MEANSSLQSKVTTPLPREGGGGGASFCIVVAGGKGLRMGADLPKQFLPIGGRPVLMHTLEAFERAIPGIRLILVLPKDQQAFWRDLCRQHHFTLPHTIADGGATRFHSVKNGLRSLSSAQPSALRSAQRDAPHLENPHPSLVAVHDGVRPFVSEEVIRRTFDAARQHGAVVPVIPVVETVRQLLSPSSRQLHPSLTGGEGGGSITVDRSLYRLVQTPQTFQLPLLLRAYEQPYTEAFTDDASVVEALGHPVTLVEGNRENIKITTPFDLTIAEALLSK